MKFIKLLGALMIVFGLFFGISASAEVSQNRIDNFNSFTTEENLLGVGKGYPKVSGGSEIFAYGGTYNYYGSSVIKPGAGPDGSTALVAGGTGAADISLMTVSLNTTLVNELSYDIKFNRLSTMTLAGNSMWGASKPLFKLTSGGKVQTTSDGSTYTDAGTYNANEWYKVVIIRTGTNKYGYLIDSQGNSIYSSISNETAAQISVFQQAANASTTATIDNAQIASYDTTQDIPSCVKSSVDGEDGVAAPRNVGLTFEFDQAILPSVAIGEQAAGVVTLQETEGDGTVTVICTKTAYNKITVAYTGLLAKNTNYTVAFDGVTNGDLACTDTITFTTEEMHVWDDVTISTVAANTEDATKTDITLTIADEFGYTTFEGMAMAIVYEPYPETDLYTMKKADMVSASGATGARTLTFDLGTIPPNAKICVILLDTTYGPIPVASGMYE